MLQEERELARRDVGHRMTMLEKALDLGRADAAYSHRAGQLAARCSLDQSDRRVSFREGHELCVEAASLYRQGLFEAIGEPIGDEEGQLGTILRFSRSYAQRTIQKHRFDGAVRAVGRLGDCDLTSGMTEETHNFVGAAHAKWQLIDPDVKEGMSYLDATLD